MSPLLFDLIILALVVLSLLLGFMRGFVNEVFTIIGWIGAVLATIYFTPVTKEYGEQLIKNKLVADLATASAIFLVTLGIFSVVSHLATSTLKGSKLSLLDRIMGFFFGGLRAVVLLGLAFLLFAYVFEPEKRPDFVNNSRATKFLEASAHWVQAVTPGLESIQVSASDPVPEKAKDEAAVTESDMDKAIKDANDGGDISEKLTDEKINARIREGQDAITKKLTDPKTVEKLQEVKEKLDKNLAKMKEDKDAADAADKKPE